MRSTRSCFWTLLLVTGQVREASTRAHIYKLANPWSCIYVALYILHTYNWYASVILVSKFE
jgi:hypothetical protein